MIFISTSCIDDSNIITAIENIVKITNNIELSGGAHYHDNLLNRLINFQRQREINFLLHCYFPPPRNHFVLNFADSRKEMRDFIKESVAFVNTLHISYYSIHAGFKQTFIIENEILKNGTGSFNENDIGNSIAWFVNTYPNIKLALENLYPNGKNINTCFLMTIDEIAEFLKKNQSVYLLLDLGHLKISSRLLNFNYTYAVEKLFNEFSSRIIEIHLSENNGEYDDHLLIHSNSVQYKLIKRYKNVIYDNKINISLESRKYPLDQLAHCFHLINSVFL